MSNSTHILYIPGLGDNYDGFRRSALKSWKLWGATAELVSIKWYDGGSFDDKYALIAAAAKRSRERGERVVVIGESAGGSLALQVGENETNIARVITLCGVARRSTPISPHLRKKAPALNSSVNTLSDKPLTDIHSIRAFADSVVSRRSSIAPGAKEHVVWSVGHLFTIVLCLTILAPYVVRIASKSQ